MKISKDIRQLSRDMVRASYVDGVLDPEKVRFFIRLIVEKRPRNYIALLQNFQRLLRLELEKRRVRIESAMNLDPQVSREIVSGLEKKYGAGLSPEYVVNPALLGGVRVRVGSDVWDSSVRNRLERLEQQF
ncbi:MAG TPA: ATP synthase F1 subunit delta [Chthoniobacterales bacterium]